MRFFRFVVVCNAAKNLKRKTNGEKRVPVFPLLEHFFCKDSANTNTRSGRQGNPRGKYQGKCVLYCIICKFYPTTCCDATTLIANETHFCVGDTVMLRAEESFRLSLCVCVYLCSFIWTQNIAGDEGAANKVVWKFALKN